MKRFILTATILLTLSAPAAAQVSVKEAWVRATVPQQSASGAFMQITSAQDARLVAVKSPVAGVVQIHEMTMENNLMKMREVPYVDLPAGKTVQLKPGGYHVMLLDLKHQLNEGDRVSLTLVIEDKGKKRLTVEIQAQVRPLNEAHEEGMHH